MQFALQMPSSAFGLVPGAHTPNQVQPIDPRVFNPRCCAQQQRLGRQRDPDIRHAPVHHLRPMKPAGATPMIVNARPLIWYVDPTTEASERYFSCQAWKLITATGGAPSWSSASINSLPRHADTPRVWKKLPETYWPLAVSGGPDEEPARRTASETLSAWSAARSWNPVAFARNSLYASHGKRL